MADNQIDMFELVKEVEKQQLRNVDDVFSSLDSLKNEEVSTVQQETPRYANTNEVKKVSKPGLPENIGPYDTRFEAFKGIVEHVSYGTIDVNNYIEGHKTALEKYFKDAYENAKDLYVVEGRVNDEITRYTSRTHLYEKGYYDGLLYVYNALKKSKELLMGKLNKEITKNL
ncbi:MAG: hypothetical protein IKS51_01580 [Erysipelotrichaceae bacterium]|nr:hypothetical protein [Erysipelotrichaceae bacterium]